MNATRFALASLAWLSLVGGAAACSSGTTTQTIASGSDAGSGQSAGGGTATVTGTLGGKTLDAVDAIALKGVYDPSYPGIVTLFIGNVPKLCSIMQETASSGANKANIFYLGFTLGATSATSTVSVGTYTASSDPNELDTVGWDAYDGTCEHTHDPGSSSATVTLTSVSPSYQGTFDVTFNGGDHVTGSFDAPLCDVSNQSRDGSDAGPACIQ